MVVFESLTCPNCGANLSITDTVCLYCGGNLIRKKKNSIFNVSDSALEMNGSQSTNQNYLQNAVAILQGKKPFLCDRNTIDKCIRNLEAAYEEEPDPLIDYFRAYIEYDYFERKHLNRNPGYLFFLERSKKGCLINDEISELERVFGNKIIIGGKK